MVFDKKTPEELYKISKSQNLTALCWDYLKKQNTPMSAELKGKFEKSYIKTIYIMTRQRNVYENIAALFSGNAISFLPLKGLVIRDYYNIPSLRYSCDLDILIHNEDFSKAKAVLEENGWTTDGVLNFHDMLFCKDQVHLELHYNICENMLNIDRVLADVWNNVNAKNGYELELDNTFFLYHQIAHAYYHYMQGGCGGKAVLDIKILREKMPYNQDCLDSYLNKSEISGFYDDILSLIDYWFYDKSPTDKDLEMEEFIINGGAYGKKCQAVQYGKKFQHFWERIFLPRNIMYAYFPRLSAHHLLLPYYHILRLVRSVKFWFSNRKLVQ